MNPCQNGHLHLSARLVRALGIAGVVVLLLMTLLPVGTASAQQKGHTGESPSATPGPPLDFDDATLDTLGDLLNPRGVGDPESEPGQVVNEAYGYTIDYQPPLDVLCHAGGGWGLLHGPRR